MKKALLQLHLAILLAGFTAVLGRLISLDGGTLVWYRLFITIVALWIMHLFFEQKQTSNPTSPRNAYLTGVIAALHWVFFFGSIKLANISIALVCYASVSFFTAILDPLLNKKRPDPVELLLGLLVILGIMFMFQLDSSSQTGIIWGLISSLLAALLTVLNKKLLDTFSITQLIRYEMTGGWILLTLLAPWYIHAFPGIRLVPAWSDLFWLLVLGLLCTVWAFRLLLSALQALSPFTVNLSYNLEPIYGIIMAFLIFREDKDLGSGFYIGLSIMLATVIFQTWRYRKKKSS